MRINGHCAGLRSACTFQPGVTLCVTTTKHSLFFWLLKALQEVYFNPIFSFFFSILSCVVKLVLDKTEALKASPSWGQRSGVEGRTTASPGAGPFCLRGS